MHDEGFDPYDVPRRAEAPSPKPAWVYLMTAGLILLPIVVVVILLGPKARFDGNFDSQATPPVTDPVVTAPRFPPEPDEREAFPEDLPVLDHHPQTEDLQLEPPSRPEPPIASRTSIQEEPTEPISNLIVLSSQATTSVFLFPAEKPDRWNPGTHPAPIDHVYLRLRLELELVSGQDIRLTFAGDSSIPTDVVLKTSDDHWIPVLGTIGDPPDLITPISPAPMSITGDHPARRLILAAVIPTSVEWLECRIAPNLALKLNTETPVTDLDEPVLKTDSLAGTWTKAQSQSWRTRYPDRLTDRIRRDDHRRLLIDKIFDRPHEFRIQFPLCDISGSARPLNPDQAEDWRIDLNHQGIAKSLPARLVSGGAVLIFYFGDTFHDCFVYTR